MDDGLIKDNRKSIQILGQSTHDASEEPSSESIISAVADKQEPAFTVASLDEEQTTDRSDKGFQGAAQPNSSQEDLPIVLADEGRVSVSFRQFKELQEEREDLHDRLLRKQAEFENFRKRTEKEKQDFYDFALFNFVKDLLPVIDGLEGGLNADDGETVEGYKRGIELVLKQFRDVLALAGLQPIRATGRIFDPNYHQAVIKEQNKSLAENEVIEELRRGYTFKERLLRPSMVKVAVLAVQDISSDKPVETESC